MSAMDLLTAIQVWFQNSRFRGNDGVCTSRLCAFASLRYFTREPPPPIISREVRPLPKSRIRKTMFALAAAISLAFAAFACAGDDDSRVAVFAAASLEAPLSELAERYETERGVRVSASFGGSQALARQIALGAPADVFFSAGSPPMRSLISEGLVNPEDVSRPISNELVVVASPALAPSLMSLESLAAPSVGAIAMPDPNLAPAGWYAERALASAGLREALRPKTVETPNVRAALAAVSAGVADAGFVYRTDARTAPELRAAFAVPPALHPPIRYQVAPIVGSPNPAAARDLAEFLASPEAADVFAAHGFGAGDSPPSEIAPPTPPSALDGFPFRTLAITLQVAVAATLMNIPLALALGWLVAKKRVRGRFFLDALASLPLALPPVAIGYALLLAVGPNGPVGRVAEELFGARIVLTWFAAALAAAVVSFPLVARAFITAMEGVDERIERSARSLGAGPMRVFFTITLPIARRGILAGALLGFVRALSEFGATIVVAGNVRGETQTLPLAIYENIQLGRDSQTLVLVALSVALAAVSVAVHNWLMAKGGRR